MRRRILRSQPPRPRGRFTVEIVLAAALSLVVSLCYQGALPLETIGLQAATAGATTVSGGFAPYAPGEEWGGGSPVDKCVACTSQGVLSEDTARSIQSGQDVDPTTGDFTTGMTLLDIPTAAGHFGISLTYDAQRAMQEARHHTTWPGNVPGPFGWGWSSDLSSSVRAAGATYDIDQPNGSITTFTKMGATTTPHVIHSSTCPSGDFHNPLKYTLTSSTLSFCAPARTDASFGTFSPFAYYQLDVSGGKTVDIFAGASGKLASDGNLQNSAAINFTYDTVLATTSHCPKTSPTSCTMAWDTVSTAPRRIVAETNAYGIVTTVFGPTGEQWQMAYTDSQAHLNTVSTPTGNATNYSYAVGATATKGYNDEITRITDPDTNATQVFYTAGMVTSTENAEGESTLYTYTRTNCASSTTGCLESHTATHPTGLLQQKTRITYPDGESDYNAYTGGLLTSSCYGALAACPGTAGLRESWQFNYNYNTTGTGTETVVLPTTTPHHTRTALIYTDQADNIYAYLDPYGNEWHYAYNDSATHDLPELCWSSPPSVTVTGMPACASPPSGATTYAYDTDGDQTSTTDPLGNVTRTAWYDNGQKCWSAPPSVTASGSNCTTIGAGTTPGARVPTGATVYHYDRDGNDLSTTVGLGTLTRRTTTRFDNEGRPSVVVPPDGQSAGTFTINPYRTVYGYTADGKVHTKKTPVGTATYLYNKDGSVVLQTDPAGATSTAYDTLNRKCWTARTKTPILSPVCSSAPTGATKYTYEDTTTAAKTVTDPDGHTTTDTYGNAELPTSPTVVYDPDGTQVTYNAYNVFGDTCVSGPVNPSRVTCPITTTTVSGDSVWTYSAEGNLRKSVDPTGVATNYTYTDRTYPTSPTVVTYAGRATSAAYNANGEVKWQHDAEGTYVSTQYGADSEPCWSGPTFSSAACTSAPSGTGVSTYTYNSVGELTQMVDNHGTGHSHTDTYGYDKDGNETSASDDNSRTVAYTYNDANQVKCIAYPIKPSPNCATAPGTTNTVVDRTYNTAGQLAHTKDWLGNTVSYAEYTPNGHLGRITYPSSTGETVDYTYDAAQNLTKVSYHGTSLAGQTDTYSYNGDEQLSASSGIVTSPSDTYNSYKQVSKASDPISATASVTHTYHYSDAGDVTSVTPTGGGSAQTFSYNSKHELTTSVTPVATNTLSSTPRAPISISGYPSTVAMAPSGATAYVANQSASTLTPIDVATDTAGTAISLPDVTDSIAITPSGSKAYLTSKSGNEVIPVTLSTSTAGTPITVGTGPTGIAIAPNGTKAYVANTGSNSVTPITLSTDTAGTAISVGTDPTSIAFTPDSAKAYVSNYNSSSVTPITVSTGTAGTAISTPATPTGIAITPDGSTAYVGSFTTNEVTAITLAHGTTSTPIHGLHGPTSIVLTSHGTTAFVANWFSGSVTPVTLAIDRNETTISVSTNPHGLALTPSNGKLFVNDTTAGKVTPVTISPTKVTVTHHHAYGYTADGQRCWSAAATTSGGCTAAPSGATSDHWNTLQQLCWSGPTTTTGASCGSPPSGATTYTYNGQDLRMNETPPSGPALAFTWDTVTGGGTPLDIDDGVNAYIYGPGSVPVEQVNLTTGSVDYLASAQDGVQTVFNSSGGVLQETNYTTYGTPVLKAGTDVTPFGFQDGYTDPSGAVYLINRYYTPKTDQFISVDPDLAQTGEPYAFTGDDPLNGSDPTGLATQGVCLSGDLSLAVIGRSVSACFVRTKGKKKKIGITVTYSKKPVASLNPKSLKAPSAIAELGKLISAGANIGYESSNASNLAQLGGTFHTVSISAGDIGGLSYSHSTGNGITEQQAGEGFDTGISFQDGDTYTAVTDETGSAAQNITTVISDSITEPEGFITVITPHF